jgi:hypothetical protein
MNRYPAVGARDSSFLFAPFQPQKRTTSAKGTLGPWDFSLAIYRLGKVGGKSGNSFIMGAQSGILAACKGFEAKCMGCRGF